LNSATLRERHIDRLLAEELETSPAFAAWFAHSVFGDRVPGAEPSSCETTISHHRVAGETDILVKLEWSSGESAEIHVEDKLDALPQSDQASRYSMAVAQVKGLAASALVAPRTWMRRHPQEASLYDAEITFEQIASEFASRANQLESESGSFPRELAKRLRWREELLNGSMNQRAVYRGIQAGELTDWNEAAAAVIYASSGLTLRISPRQRSEGRNKGSRFFRFDEVLTPYRKGKPPILQLKTAEKKHGRVSLEIRGAAQDRLLKAEAAGYDVEAKRSGTVLVEGTTENLKDLTIAEPVAEQIPKLEDAAQVAQGLIEWWENRDA